MNLYDSVYSSLPSNTFKLNSAGTAFVDALNRGLALTGTQVLTTSIVTGNLKSISAKNSAVLNFVTPVYNAKRASSSFTLEAWVRPQYFTASTMSILSHNAEYDGLWLDQDNINFTVKFATDTATVSWSIPDAVSTYHVVGVYNASKISLYINGELVSELDVSDYVSQNFKAFATTNLYIGQSTDANQVATVDGIATYTKALSAAEIYRHFAAGRRVFSPQEVAGFYGGNSYTGLERDYFQSKSWPDWGVGTYTNVEFASGELKPAVDPTTLLSKAGQWTSQYETSVSTGPLYGVILDWDGDGSFVVEASINSGSSWITVTNGQTITGTYNWTPGTIDMLVRVTFTGGVANDISEVRSLRARAFTTATVYGSFRTRPLTIANTAVSTSSYAFNPIDGSAGAGMSTYNNGGVININPDTDAGDPKSIGTIEMWHKFNGTATSKFVFDARPAGGTQYVWVNATNQLAFTGFSAVYVNGAAVTSATLVIQPNVWYHIVAVFTTAIATRVDIQTGDRTIGVMNIYPSALTAANVLAMYNMYSDYPNALLGTDVNTVTEGVSAYKLYGYDWSIAATG